MGPFLHKLGNRAFDHKWTVVTIWVVIIAALGALAATYIKPTSSAISIPGTQGQQTIDRVSEIFPDSGKGSGVIVFHTADSKVTDYQTGIKKGLDSITSVEGVSGIVSPFDYAKAISEDGKTAYVQVQLAQGKGEISEQTRDGVDRSIDAMRETGLQVEKSGDLIDSVPGEILGIAEVFGLLLALVVLVMTLGSLISAGMPVVVALVAVAASMAGLFAMSQVIEINSTTPVLAIMLGLAVGIDYSLFIISKYRTLLLQGYSYKDAAGRAVGTAGNAVLFAAATVVIALSALSIVQIPFMTTMGLAGAATVAVAAIVAVTLIPALLGMFGAKAFSKKTRHAIDAAQAKGPQAAHAVVKNTMWQRWGAAITKRPFVALAVVAVIIVTMAIPARDLTLGLPSDQYASTETTERKAYDLLSDAFGVGFNAPLIVLAENVPAVSQTDKDAVRTQIVGEYTKQVEAATAMQQQAFAAQAAAVTTPEQAAKLQADIAAAQAAGAAQQQQAMTKIDEQVAQFAPLKNLTTVAGKIAQLDDVESATAGKATDDGTKGIIQIIPKTAPSDDKTIDLINTIRDDQAKASGSSSVQLSVTGSTALQSDINKKLADAMPLYLGVIVGLSLILLIVAFRSILVPIKATLGFLLSVLAMFGAMVAIFQWGWFGIADPAPIVSLLPILAIGILFGLAMDYEFFLVSSMHESYHATGDAKKAVVNGFGQGAKVVTAAAIIMVAVFAGFAGNHDATIKSIGLGLAIGIFVDAFIVRMTFVPAIMTLLGKSAWWLPKWLDRILPHVSIEGEDAAPIVAKKQK